jgi:hypothetical protein
LRDRVALVRDEDLAVVEDEADALTAGARRRSATSRSISVPANTISDTSAA